MFGGAVALVAGEPVAGVDKVELAQQRVPRGLGEDRRGGDRARERVAVHEVALRQRQVDGGGVDEQEVGRDGEGLDGAPHGEPRGLQEIDPVDLGDRRRGDGPGEGAFADQAGELLAAGFVELLGIVQAVDGPVGIEDHRAGEDGAEQAAAPGLIDSGDKPVAVEPGGVFVGEGAQVRGPPRGGLRLVLLSGAQIPFPLVAERTWRISRALSGGQPCRAGRAGSRAWRGGPDRCARFRSCRRRAHGSGRCARRRCRSSACGR